MKKLRIAQLASNHHPVNPLSNKAIYSHVGALSNGLSARGHDVRVFASSDSQVECALDSVGPALSGIDLTEQAFKYHLAHHISRCFEYAQTERIDIVHSHFIFPLFFATLSGIPTLTSLHSPINDYLRPFLQAHKNNPFVSFSLAQRKQMPDINWYANIYHGVDMNVFTHNDTPEDYVLFLGRITQEKGAHLAIEAAKAAGVHIRVVGSSYPTEGYWQKEIEQHINGVTVRYFGEASLSEKIPLLQNARALIFPTQVDEVFGYAMIEAMACGTPVIGFNKGSVAEIVKHGETGYVVESVEEMIEAIKHIDDIDREKVRKRAELYFSTEKMIRGYENVYRRLIADKEFKATKKNNHKKVSTEDDSSAT